MPSQSWIADQFVRNRAELCQFVRFAITGAALTGLVSFAYYLLVTFSSLSPTIALTIGTALGSFIAYFVHSSFSFRSFGSRENQLNRFVRLLAVNGASYLLNLSYVYAMIEFMNWPKWAPIIAFCAITPLVSFFLYRRWVFV